MKKRYIAGMMAGVAVIAIFTICFTQGKKENIKDEKELITIGFSQVGAESDWRTANSISIKETFTPERGYDLIFEDARQDQSNQIMAIRSFIQQDVDYIIFSPVVEDGWDTVLEEAKRARIPVIVIDRMVNVKDDSLYTAWRKGLCGIESLRGCTGDGESQYCTYSGDTWSDSSDCKNAGANRSGKSIRMEHSCTGEWRLYRSWSL